MLATLRAGDYTVWRDTPLKKKERAGQLEVLNWVCLVAGAEVERECRAGSLDWVEPWMFNTPKCMAVFKAG